MSKPLQLHLRNNYPGLAALGIATGLSVLLVACGGDNNYVPPPPQQPTP